MTSETSTSLNIFKHLSTAINIHQLFFFVSLVNSGYGQRAPAAPGRRLGHLTASGPEGGRFVRLLVDVYGC